MQDPIATTTSGALRGSIEDGLVVFRGVPYAEPPVGRRRWRPAEPVAPWRGIRDATHDGPVAPQPRDTPAARLMGGLIPDGAMDEDCLTLTIWTPAVDDHRRPVLVWIHGGGFITGAGSLPIYSGASFARDGDVVVVAVNYRIGPFGYLPVGGRDDAGGNQWLTDQVTALRWIAENVQSFGGDPERITLAGQSGGAWSIVALLGSPEPPPVRRAILQSPPLGLPPRSREAAARFLQVYEAMLGKASLDDATPDELLAPVPRLYAELARWAAVVPPFQPTADATLLSGRIVPPFLERARRIELLVGWTQSEMGFFLCFDPTLAKVPVDPVEHRLTDAFGDLAGSAYVRYRDTGCDTPADVVTSFAGDELFRVPALHLAEKRAIRGSSSTFVYEFAVKTPALGGRLGACHCLDLPYVFDNLPTWQRGGSLMTEGLDVGASRQAAQRMHQAWIAFVRDGDPSDSRVGHWSPYELEERTGMVFRREVAASVNDVGGVSRRIWSDLRDVDTE